MANKLTFGSTTHWLGTSKRSLTLEKQNLLWSVWIEGEGGGVE